MVREVIADGIVLSSVLILIYLYCCVLTLAWKPAQRLNTPFSAPLALIVSIMRMLEAVVEESFALSRIWTLVRLTRLGEIMSDTAMLIAIAAMPIAVRGTLYLSIATR